MINLKYSIINAFAFVILGAVSAHASGEILRNDDGSIRYMTQSKAAKTCPQGTRLPTIRELAEESQAHGAKGIVELSQENPDSPLLGYFKISAINPDGYRDEFYYNSAGYKFGRFWFWSSSAASINTAAVYILNAIDGNIHTSFREYPRPFIATLCVPIK